MPEETPALFAVGTAVVVKTVPPSLDAAYATYVFKGVSGTVIKTTYSTFFGQRLYTLGILQTDGSLATVTKIPEGCLGPA